MSSFKLGHSVRYAPPLLDFLALMNPDALPFVPLYIHGAGLDGPRERESNHRA
jgi:hypothetical protein